mgnify:FL=1
MNIKHTIITLEDNKKYFVLDEINYNEKDYALIINVDNQSDIKIMEKTSNEDLFEVEDETLVNELKSKFKEEVQNTQKLYA